MLNLSDGGPVPGSEKKYYILRIACRSKCSVLLVSLKSPKVNPAGAGPPRHPPAAGGGIKLPPLYFYDDIVATRRDREAKLRTHLPEYLAEGVSKFGVDSI